ncbi:hypothetical protein CEXT_394641 [Caerostris extrusa]|uniref:Uncharacterized protein n=1 Tax=Caerostris extrusa TaxID=172846 RepID=A0AAV4VM36_CAEEX|nr:hypothetical protein CEXT_394641 [Caerostris extrusa]
MEGFFLGKCIRCIKMAIIFDECLSIIRVGSALMSVGNCKGIKGEVSLILLSRTDEDEDSDWWDPLECLLLTDLLITMRVKSH